jgi:hypothetical protein
MCLSLPLWQKIDYMFDKRLRIFQVDRMPGVFDRDKFGMGQRARELSAFVQWKQQISAAAKDKRFGPDVRQRFGRIERGDRTDLILECRRALGIRIRERILNCGVDKGGIIEEARRKYPIE